MHLSHDAGALSTTNISTAAPKLSTNNQDTQTNTIQFAPLHFLFSAAQKTNPASFNLWYRLSILSFQPSGFSLRK
jgi:hypothetical protein